MKARSAQLDEDDGTFDGTISGFYDISGQDFNPISTMRVSYNDQERRKKSYKNKTFKDARGSKLCGMDI
jgi:hypothetical protein